MKRIISLIICITLCSLIFAGCSVKEYVFAQDKENIASIQIVSLKYVYGEGENEVPEEIFICEIENVSKFLKDFADVKVKSINPPYDAKALTNATAIKIVYNNGEYEWITPHCKASISDFNGTVTLDEKQFASLISKYVGKEKIKTEYNFLDREDYISSIEIVKVDNYTKDDRIPENQTVIYQIPDIADFLQKFANVDCFFNSGNPTKVRANENIIKITYKGGHYELIDVNGQSKAYFDNYAYDGFRFFDDKQFESLINEYIN